MKSKWFIIGRQLLFITREGGKAVHAASYPSWHFTSQVSSWASEFKHQLHNFIFTELTELANATWGHLSGTNVPDTKSLVQLGVQKKYRLGSPAVTSCAFKCWYLAGKSETTHLVTLTQGGRHLECNACDLLPVLTFYIHEGGGGLESSSYSTKALLPPSKTCLTCTYYSNYHHLPRALVTVCTVTLTPPLS